MKWLTTDAEDTDASIEPGPSRVHASGAFITVENLMDVLPSARVG